MKRFIKILFVLLTVMITLLFVAILTLVLVVDPNEHKDYITRFIKEYTGRTLTLEGDIKLTIYPWLGLNLGKVSLGNAPGFEEPEFAKVEQARAFIKVLPLLQKRLEFSTLLLEGVAITLTRKPEGNTNLDDLLALFASDSKEPAQSSINSINLENKTVEGLDLRQANIIWDDQQNGSRYVLSEMNLNSSALALNQPIQVDFNTKLEISGATALTGQVDFNSQITLNQKQQHYWLEALQFQAALAGNSIPGGKQNVSIYTQKTTLDLPQQSLRLDGLRAEIIETILSGDLQIQQFQSNPTLLGKVKWVNSDLPKLLQQFGQTLPKKTFLKTAVLETQLEANLVDGIHLRDLSLNVDDNHLKTAHLYLDTPQQTLTTNALSLKILGIHLHSQLKLKQIFSQPSGQGIIVVAPFNPQQVFKRLGQTPLQLPAPFSLTRASFKTVFSVTPANLTLQNVHFTVDDQQLNSKQVQYYFATNRLISKHFIVKVLDLVLNGNLLAEQISTQPIFNAKLNLANFNPRQLLQRLQKTVPQTADSRALTRMAVTTQLQSNLSQLSLRQLKIRLDDSQFQGNLQIQDLQKLAIAFDLNVDNIDINRYLPPKPAKPSKPKVTPPLGGEAILLPVNTLRNLHLNGSLKVGQLKIAPITLHNITLGFVTQKNRIKIAPR